MDAKELCKKYGIALTGGAGCGKSTVAHILSKKGYFVVDADQLSREVMGQNAPGLAAAVEFFGGAILHEDGSLNRAALAEIIFNNADARKKLEEITHPLIAKELERTLVKHGLLNEPRYWFYEATLLYERNRQDDFRQIWSIDCTKKSQMERLLSRSQQPKEFWDKVIASQMEPAKKSRLADVNIDTNGPSERLGFKVDEALAKLPGRSGIMKIQAKAFAPKD